MRKTSQYATDFRVLRECVGRVADAMRFRRPDPHDAEAYVEKLVLAPPGEGGKEILACVSAGLITEIEARDLFMANVATWVSQQQGCPEPSAERWSSRDLELEVEVALLGRPACP